jgi:hypothetical protein
MGATVSGCSWELQLAGVAADSAHSERSEVAGPDLGRELELGVGGPQENKVAHNEFDDCSVLCGEGAVQTLLSTVQRVSRAALILMAYRSKRM